MTDYVKLFATVFVGTAYIIILGECGVVPRSVSSPPTTTELPDKPLSFYLDWLRAYGYIRGSNTLLTEETFEAALEDAQGFVGINSTGELDEETKRIMQAPRCGVRDVVDRSEVGALPTDAPEFRVTRRTQMDIEYFDIWHKTRITYSYKNYSPDLKRSEITEAVEEAFRRWSEVTPLTFHPVEGETPDIEIWFTTGSHNDDSPFDGRGGVLAHAYYPGPGIGGDMHFDEDESFTVKSYIGTNLFFTALHELGHSLGLDHSRNFAAVMAPLYRGYNPNVELHEDDIAAVQRLYGPRLTEAKNPAATVAPTTIPTSPACDVDNFDAVVYNNEELYVFKDTNTWRIYKNKTIEKVENFPGRPSKVVAGYTSRNGSIVLLNATYQFEFNTETYTPVHGPLPLSPTSYDLPGYLDAAFRPSLGNQTYFYKDGTFWVLDDVIEGEQPVLNIFTSAKTEVNLPTVDAAFSDNKGAIFFIHGDKYYEIDLNFNQVGQGHPRDFKKDWLGCPTVVTSSGGGPGNSASSLDNTLSTTIVNFIVSSIVLFNIVHIL